MHDYRELDLAIIIGAMKCGTSSLFRYLVEHPEISGCAKKEPNFFSDNLDKGFGWYLSLWGDQYKKERIMLEASTGYTKFPNAGNVAETISCFPGNYKFIYIVRDPLERVRSHYQHSLLAGRLEGPIYNQLHENSHIINVCKYYLQLSCYEEYFSKDNILVIKFEDLVDNPHEALRCICDFLGICSEFHFSNVDKIYNSTAIRAERGGIHDRIPHAVQGGSILKRSDSNITMSSNMAALSSLDVCSRKLIAKFLRGDLDKLQNRYDIDISSWTISAYV